MTARRVAVVTRRFWPLVGQAEIAAADLAVALRDAGQQPIVLTAQWHKSWPRQFHYENIPVVRIAQPSLRLWGDFRYMRGVTRWLSENRRELDVAVVFGCDTTPWPPSGRWVNHRRPSSCSPKATIQTGSPGAAGRVDSPQLPAGRCDCRPGRCDPRRALAAGFPAARLHVIPPGVPLPPPIRADARRDARRGVGECLGRFAHQPAHAGGPVRWPRGNRRRVVRTLCGVETDCCALARGPALARRRRNRPAGDLRPRRAIATDRPDSDAGHGGKFR